MIPRRTRRIGGSADPSRAAYWTPAEVQILGSWGARGVMVERVSNGGFYWPNVNDLTLADPPKDHRTDEPEERVAIEAAAVTDATDSPITIATAALDGVALHREGAR